MRQVSAPSAIDKLDAGLPNVTPRGKRLTMKRKEKAEVAEAKRKLVDNRSGPSSPVPVAFIQQSDVSKKGRILNVAVNIK